MRLSVLSVLVYAALVLGVAGVRAAPAAKADKSDKPPWVRWRTFALRDARDLRAAQLRTLISVDDMVGSIFRHMNLLGESDTIAFFLSDNGYLWGEHGIGDGEEEEPAPDPLRH